MKRTTKLLRALLLTLALVVCICLLFVGCDDEESSSGGSSASNSAPSTTDSSTPTTGSSNQTTNSSTPTTGSSDAKPCEHTGGTATCTAKAVCTKCGEEYGDLAAHTEEIVAGKDATCTETGLTEGKKCSVCGTTTVEQEEIPMAEHTEEVVAGKDATCTEAGLTEGKKCSVCGTTIVEQEEIPMAEHTEEVVAGKDATCTETGLTEGKKCSVCGTTTVEQEEIPMVAHTEEVVAGKDATCTEAGLTEGKKCSVCGTTTVEQEEIPAAHTEEVVPGYDYTCTEPGLTEGKKCSVCGETLVEQTEIPAAHREVVLEYKAPTCTETGLTEGKQCSACEEIILPQEEIPATGHAYGEWQETTAPACAVAGEKQQTCATCGDVAKEAIPATGHNIVSRICTTCGVGKVSAGGVEKIEASHENGGGKFIENLFDDDKTTTGIWGAQGKEYFPSAVGDSLTITLKNSVTSNNVVVWGTGNWTEANVIFYDAEGNEVKTVKVIYSGGDVWGGNAAPFTVVSGEEITFKSMKIVSLTVKEGGKGQKTAEIEIFVSKACEGEHIWQAATCTDAKNCALCGFNDNEPLGHDEQYEVVDPTCTEKGITNITCSRCDYTSTKDEKEALGHTGGDATCVELKVCTRCGESYGEYASHTYNTAETGVEGTDYEITTAPTCITKGVKTYKCTVCAALATDAEYIVEVDMIDHVYDVAGKVTAPTCISTGYTTYGCSSGDCGLTQDKDETPMIDHVYDVAGKVTAPTCISTGYTTYGCSSGDCGLTQDKDETPMIDHVYDVEGETVAPTCCTKGYTTYSCSAGECGLTENRDETNEIDHVYDVEGETVAPTCSAEGYTVYGCSAGECGLTENRDFTARVAHSFAPVNDFDEIQCSVCSQTYRNVTTVVTTGDGGLCLGGCEEGNCTCNVKVEWNGYVKPSAPEAIVAGEAFTKTEVAEKENAALEIGGGLIKLVSEAEANYTITIGEDTIEVSGTEVIVDLYKYESVTSVTIVSDADATVVFYEKLA